MIRSQRELPKLPCWRGDGGGTSVLCELLCAFRLPVRGGGGAECGQWSQAEPQYLAHLWMTREKKKCNPSPLSISQVA